LSKKREEVNIEFRKILMLVTVYSKG